MAEPAMRRATYQDVIDAPDDCVAQVVDGELHVHPRPAGPHGVAATGLGGDLFGPFQRGRDGPGGWVFVFEPELHLADDIVVPDIAAWRTERAPKFDAAFVEVAPDWVCEVVSPRSGRLDRGAKADLYASERVSHLWIVDPIQNQIETFELSDIRWARLGAWSGNVQVRIPPFDAIELDLGPLWVMPPPGSD